MSRPSKARASKGKSREMPPPDVPLRYGLRSSGEVASTSESPASYPPQAQSSEPSQSYITNHPFRSRPQITPDGPDLPSRAAFVILYHPANNLPFLSLPAYDHLPDLPLQFGLHHDTVLTACMIVACNRSGYLSSSCNSNDRVLLSEHSYLLPGSYYYHINDIEIDEFYPLCPNFKTWSFPHDKMPPSWSSLPLPDDLPINWPATWSLVSEKVKNRDNVCLVSGSTEYLTSAHIVPREEEVWLEQNQMHNYLADGLPLHPSSRNLFSLRYDLHLAGFDHAQFVILPKNGKLVVHFLQRSSEAVKMYHNTIFDHNNKLSPEALYSRFAWALFRITGQLDLGQKGFRLLETGKDNKGPTPGAGRKEEGGSRGGGGQDTRRKRKRGDGGGEGDDTGTGWGYGEGTGKADQHTFGHKSPDALSLQPDDWLSDVVFKMAPGNSSSVEADIHEIEEDKRKAASILPFLVDSSIVPTAYHYHNILTYPGIRVVERRKQAYLDSHPNIRAHSGLLMEDDGGLDDSD